MGDFLQIINKHFRVLISRKIKTFLGLSMLVISPLAVSAQASSEDGFVVEDIKVVGLQRMELGTFFNMLPLQVGEQIGRAHV